MKTCYRQQKQTAKIFLKYDKSRNNSIIIGTT